MCPPSVMSKSTVSVSAPVLPYTELIHFCHGVTLFHQQVHKGEKINYGYKTTCTKLVRVSHILVRVFRDMTSARCKETSKATKAKVVRIGKQFGINRVESCYANSYSLT
eukprot:6514218-Pyramimonas_sp.AAC.2